MTLPSGTRPTDVLETNGVGAREGLALVDSWLVGSDESTLAVVAVPDMATGRAVAHHVRRRAVDLQRFVVGAEIVPTAGTLRELSERLGMAPLSWEPIEAGRQLVAAAQQALVILQGEVRAGSWEHEVLEHMALQRARTRVILIGREVLQPLSWQPQVRTIALDPTDPEAFRVYWDGLLSSARGAHWFASLAELDQLASNAILLALKREDPIALSSRAQRLLAYLCAAQRSWVAEPLSRWGYGAALEELIAAGMIRRDGAFLIVEEKAERRGLQNGEHAEFARLVADSFPQDPWAQARAAAAWLEAGEGEVGERQLAHALGLVPSAAARQDLWELWHRAVQHLGSRLEPAIVLRTAELALAVGDNDAGLALVQALLRVLPIPSFASLLLLGRLQLAGGDLVLARVTLERAMPLASGPRERAAVLSHQAEAAYWTGDTALASELASEALRIDHEDPEVRLVGRAVLGKLLLGRNALDEAEGHFSADEVEAERVGLAVACLRARLNRAVVLILKHRLEEARTLLEKVLEEGEKLRNPNVIARALLNLGVTAEWRKDRVQAIEFYQRGILVCQQLGDVLATHLLNLAGLRLKLGQLDLAEHTLALARRLLKPGAPDSVAAKLSVLAAQVSLERGQTAQAVAQVHVALEAGRRAKGCEQVLGAAHRLLARVALEDGNLSRAAQAVELAQKLSLRPEDKAEHALLKARVARAQGHADPELIQRAATFADEANDEMLCIECALLRSEQARSDGDLSAARDALRDAQVIREGLVGRLPQELRADLLGRRLLHSIERHQQELEYRLATAQRPRARDALVESDSTLVAGADLGAGFVGGHPNVVRVFDSLRRIARSSSPVLLQGETGTGKELMAEALHAFSDRRKGPLVKVNCAALVENLLLSELFGHERGAFTGALTRRRGRFELAEGGTIFLDEIGDISSRTQVALLRVLQDGSFERVGGGTPVRSNARVVFATHRDLRAMVGLGVFREDLYYRLSALCVEIPPLRDRGRDLQLLADHFLRRIALERCEPQRRLSTSAMQLLESHTWPGNVRELQNVLRAATLLSDHAELLAEDLASHLAPRGPAISHATAASSTAVTQASAIDSQMLRPSYGAPLEPAQVAYHHIRSGACNLGDLKRQIERECVERALQESGGNITRAAQLLGMKRPRLSQLVKDLGLRGGAAEE